MTTMEFLTGLLCSWLGFCLAADYPNEPAWLLILTGLTAITVIYNLAERRHMKLRKLATIAILPLGLMGCSPQGIADLNGAILGAAMGGPLGAVAGVDMAYPNSDDSPTPFVIINNTTQPAPQDNQENSDGWVDVQSGDSTILVPDSMRGVYQQ